MALIWLIAASLPRFFGVLPSLFRLFRGVVDRKKYFQIFKVNLPKSGKFGKSFQTAVVVGVKLWKKGNPL